MTVFVHQGALMCNCFYVAYDGKFLPAAVKEGGESLTRTVLLVDPPLNNKPIVGTPRAHTHTHTEPNV